MELDYKIIKTQYVKDYNRDLADDYYKINYVDFYDLISGLGGDFAEVIRYRKGLLGDLKLSKEERKFARKHFMTPEIEEWRQKEFLKQDKKNISGVLNGLGSVLEQQRQRNITKAKSGRGSR